jgi:hypothetical protein
LNLQHRPLPFVTNMGVHSWPAQTEAMLRKLRGSCVYASSMGEQYMSLHTECSERRLMDESVLLV